MQFLIALVDVAEPSVGNRICLNIFISLEQSGCVSRSGTRFPNLHSPLASNAKLHCGYFCARIIVVGDADEDLPGIGMAMEPILPVPLSAFFSLSSIHSVTSRSVLSTRAWANFASSAYIPHTIPAA